MVTVVLWTLNAPLNSVCQSLIWKQAVILLRKSSFPQYVLSGLEGFTDSSSELCWFPSAFCSVLEQTARDKTFAHSLRNRQSAPKGGWHRPCHASTVLHRASRQGHIYYTVRHTRVILLHRGQARAVLHHIPRQGHITLCAVLGPYLLHCAPRQGGITSYATLGSYYIMQPSLTCLGRKPGSFIYHWWPH